MVMTGHPLSPSYIAILSGKLDDKANRKWESYAPVDWAPLDSITLLACFLTLICLYRYTFWNLTKYARNNVELQGMNNLLLNQEQNF